MANFLQWPQHSAKFPAPKQGLLGIYGKLFLGALRRTAMVGKCHIFDTSAATSSAALFCIIFCGGGNSSVFPCASNSTSAAKVISTVFRFTRFSGISSASPLFRASQNSPTGHSWHCGERCVHKVGAKLHHRLVPIAGRFFVKQLIRALLQLLPRPVSSQVAAHRAQSRQNARHIAVQHGQLFPIRDTQDCRRRIRPFPGNANAASGSRGNSPLCFATICRAAFCKFRARE